MWKDEGNERTMVRECVEDYVNQVHVYEALSNFLQTYHLKIEVKITRPKRVDSLHTFQSCFNLLTILKTRRKQNGSQIASLININFGNLPS